MAQTVLHFVQEFAPSLLFFLSGLGVATAGFVLLQRAQRKKYRGLLRRQLQRHESEKALTEKCRKLAEEKYRSIFENAVEGIIQTSPEGAFLTANPAFARMLGYRSPSELLSKVRNISQQIYVHARDRDEFKRRVVQDGKAKMEFEAWRKDRSIVWLSVSARAVSKPNGQLDYFESIAEDITRRREAEESVRCSEERYRSLVAATSSVVWTASPDGQFVTPQLSWARYTGQPWEQQSGWGWTKMLPPEDAHRVREKWEEALAGQGYFQMTGRLWSQAARGFRSFEARAVPLRNRDGSIREWVGTLVDVDERKKAEEEQQKFKFLADNANDAYLLANRSSQIVYANRVASELLGYDHDELMQMTLPQIERGHDGARFDELFSQPKDTRTAPYESVYERKSGGWLPVEISVSRLQYLGEDFIFAVARDISERKAVEQSLRNYAEELARSNQELEQFAYVSSHDLKEPLRMVTVYVQMLQNHLQGKLDDRASEYLGYAVQGSRRMLALINDLLAYSRLGRETSPFETVSCDENVTAALQNLRTAIEESGAQVEVSPMPEVYGNAGQITQLFQNLIANAIKFRGGQPPVIKVSAQKSDGEWLFSVADNGIGIQPRYLERIFVIFQRLHTAQKYPGTGIGLSICKKIVENHGGRIWVESNVGEGSVFHFTLPAQIAARAPAPARKEQVYASH